jgi:hypothetical protein
MEGGLAPSPLSLSDFLSWVVARGRVEEPKRRLRAASQLQTHMDSMLTPTKDDIFSLEYHLGDKCLS